jgi:hypothetical protein
MKLSERTKVGTATTLFWLPRSLRAALCIACAIVWACSRPATPVTTSDSPGLPEWHVVPYALPEPWSNRETEVSGLAWWGDSLVLLPQYPARVHQQLAVIDSVQLASGAPLTPTHLTLTNPEIVESIPGFEGLEAISFHGEAFAVTVEARQGGDMTGHLVTGTVDAVARTLTFRADCVVPLPMPAQLDNKSFESVVPWQGGWLALYEVNGDMEVADSFGVFVSDACVAEPRDVPSLPYRLTDVAMLDTVGTLAVLNYHWPGETELRSSDETLRTRWGVGTSHQHEPHVERIVFWRIGLDGSVVEADRAPVWFSLDADVARNWEGVVGWQEGFLVVTDKHPGTILARIVPPGRP